MTESNIKREQFNGPTPIEQFRTEQYVATVLRVSRVTVGRERKRRKLEFVRVGSAIRITDGQLAEYIRLQRSDPSQDSITKERDKSVSTGSRGGQTVPSGAEPGSIENLDKRDVHRLAQRILGKRK